MPESRSLTVVIVAKNEARNIGDCVRSAAFADEVLVLDSNSSDDTVALARAAGARVVSTDWPGYGPQVARGFGMAHTDWVPLWRSRREGVAASGGMRSVRSMRMCPTR